MANTSELPSVFWFDLTPKAGVAPADLIAALLARTSSFALAARPNLSPSLFTHRILRGKDGSLAWEVIFSGLDLPGDDDADLGEAIAAEIHARIADLAEVSQVAPYVDMQPTAPGRGFARAAAVSAPVEAAASGPTAFSDDGGAGNLPSWDEYAADSGAPHAGSALPDDLIAEIGDARAAMPVESNLSAVGTKGHAYAGLRDTAHLAYLRDYLEGRAARAGAADRRKILAFLAIQPREGTTAAINTYDNQIVTWGSGWGGLGGLGIVMGNAVEHEPFRDALGRCGVRYRGKNTYDVVDVATKTVVTGSKEALEIVRASLPLLYMLIHVARDAATRDASTEAQLHAFMDSSANISGSDAIATQALFNMVAHLKHWAPGYVIGAMEWAAPQLGGSPSPERDQQLAVLVGRYFYGKAHQYKWIPDWKQFQRYWQHMKEDGLDCLSDPFIQAAAAPTENPFATVPAPTMAKPAPKPSTAPAPAPATAPAPAHTAAFTNQPLAGQPDLENIAAGHAVIKQGSHGAGVKALQQALIALGFAVPGGADGAYGPGAESAVKAFQSKHGLPADGVVGPATLKAIDAELGAKR